MKTIIAVSGLILAAAFPMQAFAQFATNSGADTVLYADDTVSEGGVITLTGQADIRQGDVRLLADKVQIYTGGAGAGAISTDRIDRVVATGNFYYITPEQEVRGDKGVYTAATDTFVVTGEVILLQDGNVVTGSQLDYNLTTRAAKVTSSCSGRKCPKAERVAILIKNTDGQPVTN